MSKFTELEVVAGDEEEIGNEDNWSDIFEKLDQKDGVPDGRIDKNAFLEWIDTLSFQDVVMLEVNNGISRRQLRFLIESADVDDNFYIDKEEFLTLIQKHSGQLEKIQQNNFLKYMRIAAYADEYRWWPPPWFTLMLIFLNIFIYIYHVIHFLGNGEIITWSGPIPLCSVLIFNSEVNYQAWRYFTYSFVHAGLEHILVNMCLLILVGLSLEMSNSWWRVGLVYTIGVISGSLGTAIIKPGTYLAGASGGVYALASAHVAALLLNWKEDSLILRQRIRNKKSSSPTFGKIVRVARILIVVGILSVDVITVISNYVQGESSSTSYTAHLSGVIMGVLVGVVMLKNRRVQHWERWLIVLSWVSAAIIITALVILNIVFADQSTNTMNSIICDKYIP